MGEYPFIDAINRDGAVQRIPKAWLEPGSPFRENFTLPEAKPKEQPKKAPAQQG